MAVATYVPAGLLGLSLMFGFHGDIMHVIAGLSAIGAAVTVYCTGMIYGSLRTIRQWNKPLVPVFYLAASAASGAVLLGFLYALFGYTTGAAELLIALLIAATGAVKLLYWRQCDADKGQYTAEMATGLGKFGRVRPLEPPHTRPNFVMREMGYQVGRKHAAKLRRLVLICLFVVPTIAIALAAVSGFAIFFLFAAALVSMVAGLIAERWLFFAEAEHVSMLFYGAERA